MDEKEFEGYLVLTGIISDAEADNRLLLYKVSKKLSDLFEAEFDEGFNPIGFSRLCRTIDSYLKNERYGYAALKVAYRQMEEVLLPELIVFYEELAQGVEASPESKKSDQFDNEKKQSASASLDEKINPQSSHQGNDSDGHVTGANQNIANSGGNFQNQSGYQNGINSGFPTLDGNRQASPVTKGAGGLAHTLMALKNSVGSPDTLHNIFPDSDRSRCFSPG